MGISGSTLYRAQEKRISVAQPEIEKVEFGSSERVKAFDYGFSGALSLGYIAKNNRYFIEGGYYHGLPNVTRFTTSRNRTLSLQFGITHNLKHKHPEDKTDLIHSD